MGVCGVCSAQEPALAQVDQALESPDCTLGADCADFGPLVEEELPSVQACTSAGAALPMRWIRPLATVACPFGECSVYEQQLSLDADASLVSLGAVQLPSQHGSGFEGGLWLTRYTPAGELVASSLLDFSAPPPGLEVERHAALQRDADGHTLLVSSRTVLPFDEPRATRATRLARGRELTPTLPVFVSPLGWGVTAAYDSEANEWAVGSQRGLDAEPHAVIARFQRLGRVRWSRSWSAATELVAVQTGPERAVWALIRDTAADTHSLYKLDPRGRVVWRRVISSSQEQTQLRVRPDGSSVLASTEPTDFFGNVRLLELDAAGHARAAFRISDLFDASTRLALDPSGAVVLPLAGFDAAFLLTLDWYALPGDGVCQRSSYQWPSDASFFPDRVVVQADARGARYFASPQFIGQLSEGGTP
jgi:hypothetical protein